MTSKPVINAMRGNGIFLPRCEQILPNFNAFQILSSRQFITKNNPYYLFLDLDDEWISNFHFIDFSKFLQFLVEKVELKEKKERERK